ncbi:hypothetical protein PPROV_000482400 [Pycnococcus provasolii]|uniref:Retrotransposon gag domain-containing protein n=1 Tax=Pycnococcus provasolii TaxID=41880 RepID=A0A830HM16_9CHLO|nr:hypothetical protein PPROV_000482400 [Pycnococcus provasolii]
MTDNTSTSNTNNRVTKAALEAEVEELREQLAKLVDDTQLNSAQLSSVKRPKVLNLDITPAEKHPEVYAEWTGSLKRYLKRLQVKQPALTEKEFLLETFFKLIVNTYRIKPQGEVATELFRSARQGKRTPREYLVHLEELQLDIDIDATVDEKISPELLYYKFKTTL